MSGTLTYRQWARMRNNAQRYGDPRCDQRWLKFKNFFDDMGMASRDWHLHRLDKTKPYSKENAVWKHQKTGMTVPPTQHS